MNNPMLNMMLQAQAATQQETLKMMQRMASLPKVQEVARDTQVGTTPHDVVYEKDSLKLLHYRNDAPVQFQEPILVCFALVNRPYILDLQPERSVVRQLLRRGFDVYLIDWGVPTAADRTMRLHDYICGLMKGVTDYVLKQSHTENLNVLGYCMGGTMSTMFTALYPEVVRNLMLMAAPIDFDHDESLLNVWVDERYFDVDALIDNFGNCPGSLLQSAFQLMKPVQNFVEKYVTFYEKMDDPKFLENFFAMERWGNDNIPVAGETFREFVKYLYQRNQLVKGQMMLGDKPVKLENVTCPVLLLTADFDHLVPPCSTLAMQEHVGSQDVTSLTINAGHVGLAVSSKAHKKLWPEAAEWLAERSTAASPAESAAS